MGVPTSAPEPDTMSIINDFQPPWGGKVRHLNHAQHEASASIFMGKIVNSVRHEAAASIFVNKTGHWIAPVGQKMIGEVTKARGRTPSAAIFLRDSNDALQSWKIIYEYGKVQVDHLTYLRPVRLGVVEPLTRAHVADES
jgi:hypothetical protein